MLAINKSKPTMSAATYALVNELFDRGVFRKVNPDLLTPDRAELVLTCFDMHGVHDTIGHHRMLGGVCRCCAHLSYPGGALIIAPNSKLAITKSGYRADMTHLDAIQMAIEELGVERICPYVHVPCSAARLSGMTDLETLEMHVAAKNCLHNRFPKIDVALMVHIDWVGYPEANDREMETYKFDHRKFISYRGLLGTSAAVA